jgi:(2R)-3-sulfolactate dehydrogenase (NADP+)
MDRYFERVEAVVGRMLADAGVRLPGARRFSAATAAKSGIEVPDELVGQIEKLCTT